MKTALKWAVAKNITLAKCTETKSGFYPILGFTAIKKFKTQAEARLFRKAYTGKAPVQIVNTLKSAVSR